MSEEILNQINNIQSILDSKESVKEKYFKIKSLEMSLLEHLVCKETFTQSGRYKLTNAAKFINTYFLTQNIWTNFEKYEILAAFTLAALKEILKSEEKKLEDIEGFRLYEKYYNQIHQELDIV